MASLLGTAGLVAEDNWGFNSNSYACSFGQTHRIVIQVDSSEALTQKIALKNVGNLIKHYGSDHVKIELVAYGPGLSILMVDTPNADTVREMASKSYIRFSACNNSIQAYTRKHGHAPELIDGVKVVPSGTARIVDLEEDGYVYLKP
jgi:intracellular sulfur oxidation DsrE/DsrF family protein